MVPTLFAWATVVVFLAASALQLGFWHGRKGRASLWLAIACLAAAATAAAGALERDAMIPAGTAEEAGAVFLLAWLAAVAWFVVDITAGDVIRRGAALAATLLLALVLLERLPWPVGNPGSSSQEMLALPFLAALAMLGVLVLDAAWRSWSSGLRLLALGMCGGLGGALLAVALQVREPTPVMVLPAPALYLFLLTLALLVGEFAVPAGSRSSPASRLAVVGELSASIAHEINQPLGAILSNVDACEIMMEDDDPSLAEIRIILGDIRRDALRASDVIRHVRSLVRKPELVLERLDANELVAEVITLMAPDARRRRIPTVALAAPQPAWIRGDRSQMQQVLINLVSNAMDAIEAAPGADIASTVLPPVLISVSTGAGGEVAISVSDAGPGIPKEHLGQLFDTFYTSKPHGMGLGLPIARSIVEAHGGRIRAGNNDAAGATFLVTLPPHDWAGAS